MRNYLIKIIQGIEDEKKGKKIYPTHSTLGEIKAKIISDLTTELKELEKSEIIKIGHTINDLFIKIL